MELVEDVYIICTSSEGNAVRLGKQ